MENLIIKYFPNLDRIRTLKETMLKGEIPMYESPIEAMQHYSETIQREEENEIITQIQEKIGIVFDRDELIKALNYDRNQYQKGYEDAKKKYQPKWIPTSEREPEEYGEYYITWTTPSFDHPLIAICEGEVTSEWDDERDRWKFEWLLEDYIKAYPDVKVTAWMPLIEAYKENVE